MTEPAPALYIHVPFCAKLCPYCDFAVTLHEPGLADAYFEALEREFAGRARALSPATIFIGGGTPTALSEPHLERLLRLCGPAVSPLLAEFSIETNPNTLTARKLRRLRQAGVTRVSIGVQTFCRRGLEILGRAHTPPQARAAVARARAAGFDNLSVDLIYGWPGQTEAEWRADLDEVIRLRAPHVSAYCLSYEPGTLLHARRERGELRPLPEEEERELFDLAEATLAAAGLPRYEVSNFARPGYECRHNLNYWRGGEYAGLGAGAHSHLDGTRSANEKDTRAYVRAITARGAAQVFSEKLPPEAHARETVVIWLRLAAGIDRQAFRQRTGFDLERLLAPELPALLADGRLEWCDRSRLRLTRRAFPLADSVLAELVASPT